LDLVQAISAHRLNHATRPAKTLKNAGHVAQPCHTTCKNAQKCGARGTPAPHDQRDTPIVHGKHPNPWPMGHKTRNRPQKRRVFMDDSSKHRVLASNQARPNSYFSCRACLAARKACWSRMAWTLSRAAAASATPPCLAAASSSAAAVKLPRRPSSMPLV